MHVAGVSADPATFEHVDPALVGNRRELLISELSGQGHRSRAGARRRDRARRRRRRPRDRAGQGARAPRLPLRGRRRVVRAAAAQGERRVRAAVPARVLARDRREAGRRPCRDRGDDQDLGRRRALRPHRRGQRSRSTRSTARCATRSSRSIRTSRDIDLVNFKVRILDETKGTGAVTRVLLDASDGDERVGLDRRLGERDRGVVGGARRLARIRDAGGPGPARRRSRAVGVRTCGSRSRSRGRCSARARRSACSRCCARAAVAGAAAGGVRAAFALGVGAPHASAVSSGTAGLHLALRAVGVSDGDEVITSPFSFVASANVPSTSVPDRCSPTSIRSR